MNKSAEHGPVMTGAGTPPFCKCGWVNRRRTGPILADHLAEVGWKPVTPRPLHKIADEIAKTWPKPYFGAVPYLSAMRYLATTDDMFGDDPATDIIIYFLSNATTWRGDDARRIKAELKSMLPARRAR